MGGDSAIRDRFFNLRAARPIPKQLGNYSSRAYNSADDANQLTKGLLWA
jgi:hypothetical protein